jgi:hypothetical protein
MTSPLWNALGASDIDHSELTSLFLDFFSTMYSTVEDIDNHASVVRMRTTHSAEEPTLVLHYRDGVLVDIDAGPDLAPTQQDALVVGRERGPQCGHPSWRSR